MRWTRALLFLISREMIRGPGPIQWPCLLQNSALTTPWTQNYTVMRAMNQQSIVHTQYKDLLYHHVFIQLLEPCAMYRCFGLFYNLFCPVYQAWRNYTQAALVIAPGLGLSAPSKNSSDFKIFQWKNALCKLRMQT